MESLSGIDHIVSGSYSFVDCEYRPVTFSLIMDNVLYPRLREIAAANRRNRHNFFDKDRLMRRGIRLNPVSLLRRSHRFGMFSLVSEKGTRQQSYGVYQALPSGAVRVVADNLVTEKEAWDIIRSGYWPGMTVPKSMNEILFVRFGKEGLKSEYCFHMQHQGSRPQHTRYRVVRTVEHERAQFELAVYVSCPDSFSGEVLIAYKYWSID